ncbi:expressed unknown protein [Seminavis robusta]|nr:expressed unknown protein [Seminavis robusta]|eukprot:Sro2554_g331090.1 n/a (111) ;mRNA; r:13253-13585
MIDANGWYRLKSLAVGGGPAPENDKNCTVLAQLVNDQLQDLDSREMTTDEAITHILAILGGGEEIDGNGTAPLLSHDCELEIAYTNAKTGGRLHRQSLKSFTTGRKEPIS